MSSPKGFARFIIVLTTVTAAIMELIDTSIVNVGLSEMAGSLGVNIEDISWVITSYAIANVIIIPMTGFLAEYFGRKNYYIVSMIIFTIASYMCAQSTDLVELIIWRFVQGVGGGALLSTSQAILFDAFPPEDRPMASGLFGMGIVLGPTLGPTVGGYLIEHFSWPWMFLVNLPIGIIATILAYTFIDKKPGEGKKKESIKIDYIGIALLMVGIGTLQFVLERGEAEDWFSSDAIKVCAVLAVVGVVGFIIYELKTPHPVVNLRVMRYRPYAFTTLFTFVAGLGLFTSVFVYPVLAQRVLGFSALETGLSLLPPTLAGVIMMPIIGKVMSKGVSPIPFIVVGFILFACYSWLSADVSPDVGRWAFFFPLLVRAFGISMSQLPLINQAVAGLQPKEYAAGISLNNMIRQIGGAFGIAMANNYISHQYAQHRADMVANTYDGAPAMTERLNAITQSMITKTGDAATAGTKALSMIDRAVDKQAYYLAYLDTFHLIGIFFIVVIPLVVFLRKKKTNAPPAPIDQKAVKEAMEAAH
ncbi:DHA2 family efflux MFS transporter permease subunit [Pseudoflavitalea sp. G-6-1-2]|uniref:DHA2 family efflux MFS transporter permease subunit n=1 Tax=Pseudoflavitalea sp. G-6-1-2 TaxID=2728841 RepID=UPI00146F431D|nr:DHA2 family efflux MFS transporter permease subunit [Pseudoflavitalea sp. G-6-1-2]NML19793.1 DHA2 family efflux MFS transporter permease subunit [Pseudoflavitalea sp. G-6-1-2]